MLVDFDDVFCRAALERGLVTAEAVAECRRIQETEQKKGRRYYVGQLLIRQRHLTCEQFLELENALKHKLYECEKCKARYAREDIGDDGGLECKGCGAKLTVQGGGRLSMAEILASRDPRDLTISLVTAEAAPGMARTSSRGRPAGADIALTTRSSSRQRKNDPVLPQQLQAQKRGPTTRLSKSALALEARDLEGLERYEILEELGRGGMGIVFKARQVDIDRLCALKVIKTGPTVPEVQINRFVQEAKSAARLGHPNVVTVYDCGRYRDMFFVAMELIPGRSLSTLLVEQKLPVERTLEIVQDVLAAAHYAHENGVIHRDLKPGNILVEEERGRAKLIDFGLAKDHEQALGLTQEGQILGSPFYLSPEQTRGQSKDVDARSDVFAMGVILYEMLTRQRPFTGRSAAEVYSKILHSRPTPPAALDPEIDQELQALVLKALEKEPGDRFQTAEQMAEALRAYQASRAERADRPGSGRHKRRSSGPNKRKTAPSVRAARPAAQSMSTSERRTTAAAPGRSSSSLVLPIALGAFVLVGAGLGIKAASRPAPSLATNGSPQPPPDPTDHPEEGPETPPPPPPRQTKTLAQLAYEQAEEYARAHADDPATTLVKFRDAAGREGKEWAQKAASRADALTAQLEQEVAAATSSARARAAEGKVAEALKLLDAAEDRLEAAQLPSVDQALRSTRSSLTAAAIAGARELAEAALALGRKGEHAAAAEKLGTWSPVGIEEADRLIAEAKDKLEALPREQARAALEALNKDLERFNTLLPERRFGEALALLETIKENPSHRPDVVAVFDQLLGRARRVIDGALSARSVGRMVELEGVKGKVEKADAQGIQIKTASGPVTCELGKLPASVIEELFLASEGGKASEAALDRAAFHLLESREDDAFKALDQAKKAGLSLGPFQEEYERLSRVSRAVEDDTAMLLIPAGTFFMGTTSQQPIQRYEDEWPGREVALEAFQIDRYEVTNRQYEKFLEWLSKQKDSTRHKHCYKLEPGGKDHTPLGWKKDARFTGDALPVVGVDWFDAFAYAGWAGKRLPTEAEWERAARGTDGRRWPWGEWAPAKSVWAEALCGFAIRNSAGRAKFEEWVQGAERLLFPVDSVADGKSPDGAFHMTGNAAEWTADWYAEDYYRRCVEGQVNRSPPGPPSGTHRVARGGCWYDSYPQRVSTTFRLGAEPATRDLTIGFRCAKDPEKKKPR